MSGAGTRPIPGGEGAHPKPAPRRLRAHLAAYGFVLCGVLAFFTWRAGHLWAAIPLTVLAVLAVVDLFWLRHKGRRRNEEGLDVPPPKPGERF